jgi:hypothetical protein
MMTSDESEKIFAGATIKWWILKEVKEKHFDTRAVHFNNAGDRFVEPALSINRETFKAMLQLANHHPELGEIRRSINQSLENIEHAQKKAVSQQYKLAKVNPRTQQTARQYLELCLREIIQSEGRVGQFAGSDCWIEGERVDQSCQCRGRGTC